jgi:hypothetical protein
LVRLDWRVAAVGLTVAWLAATGVPAYPGGTPNFQTDVAPYCAACHSSTAEADLAGVRDRAVTELALNKHYAAIRAGLGPYQELPEVDRARLVEQLVTVDRNATIALEAPAQVAPGEILQVTIRLIGGAGPVVGVGLVDRAHRYLARPASALGWQVVGAPTVIGPGGPQTEWIERRPERDGRGVTFVNVERVESSVDRDTWSRAKVIFSLRAPLEAGDYPLVGAFFYGTEKAAALSTRPTADRGPQPLGGFSGASGRIKFSERVLVSVKPTAAPVPAP